MNKVVSFIKWVCSDFLKLTTGGLILLYIWWFRLNPFAFGPGEQASDPLIFGLVLLLVYIVITGIVMFSQKYSFVKAISYVLAVLLLAINALFVFVYLPRIEASAHFGKTTYYITSNFPFLECCGYHQFTEWQGIHYDSGFFAYNLPQLKFIYDEKSNEVSLVDISEGSEQLYATLGQQHRDYDGYAKLGNYVYYGSLKRIPTNEEFDWTYHFSLYRCELDNTSCIRLPMEYISEYDGYIKLYANEITKEIYFYREPTSYTLPEELVYIYSEHPRCYVDGCHILDK
jgi:hypothetical protein